MENLSESTVLEPVMGKELSSLEYESLNEQLHHAIVALKDQKQRDFVVKRHDMRTPVTLRTPTVASVPAREERIASFFEQTRKRWKFMLTMEEAQRRIEARHLKMEENFGNRAPSESGGAKRRLRGPVS
jgi:hypothetical protein